MFRSNAGRRRVQLLRAQRPRSLLRGESNENQRRDIAKRDCRGVGERRMQQLARGPRQQRRRHGRQGGNDRIGGQPGTGRGRGAGGAVGTNGTVLTGSADGTPFTSVGSVLSAGMPDVAASTVIYVFSNPI